MTVRQHPQVQTRYYAFMASHGWIPGEGENLLEVTQAFRRQHPNWEYQSFISKMMREAAAAGRGARFRSLGGEPFAQITDHDEFDRFLWAQVERKAEESIIAALDAVPWCEEFVSEMLARAGA